MRTLFLWNLIPKLKNPPENTAIVSVLAKILLAALGKSVKYRNGKIVYDPSETSNGKVTKNRTMEDGTKQNFAKELLKHEIRVLMTRGVNGLYIYACDDQLRKALKKAAEQE